MTSAARTRPAPARSADRRRPAVRRTPPPPPPVAAPVGRRLVAAVVDLTLVPVVVVAATEAAWRSGLLGLAGVSEAGWVSWSWSFGRVAWTITAAALAYHALCTARWGATAGLRLTGLRVVTDAGAPVGSSWRALARGAWAAALYLPSVLAPVLAIVATVLVATGGRRSPADRATGTRVVRARDLSQKVVFG